MEAVDIMRNAQTDLDISGWESALLVSLHLYNMPYTIHSLLLRDVIHACEEIDGVFPSENN